LLTSIKLLYYILPSATLLVNALKTSAHLGDKALYPLSWQIVYRQLSALALDLEMIAETLDYHDARIRAGSLILLNTLDEALSARALTVPLFEVPQQPANIHSPLLTNEPAQIQHLEQTSLDSFIDGICTRNIWNMHYPTSGNGTSWAG
jgi:hypothetical protein